MSMYEQRPPAPQGHMAPPAPVQERSANHKRGAGAAIAAALLNVISAITLIVFAVDAVKQQIAATADPGESVTPDMVDVTSERAQDLITIYSAMAYNTIFWSLVLVLLAWLALRGGRVTRIFSVVILIISLLVKAGDLLIAMPGITLIADAVFAVTAVAAVVLLLMPAQRGQRGR